MNSAESIVYISENGPASDCGHWDAMAAAYRVWENFGTTRASLQPFISDILSPVIIAGTGAGAIQSELSSSGLQVYGVDQSVPMLQVARKKRRQQAVCALAQRLPFEDAAFNTAIITTGVLETDPVSPPALIFDEIDRVLSTTGMLLVSTISWSEKFVRAGREIGVVVGNTVHQRRHYEIWRTRNQKKDLSDLVAKWRRLDQRQTCNMIVKHANLIEAIVAGFDHLAQAARQNGLDPEIYLRRCTDYTIKSRTIGEYQKLFDRYHRRIVKFYEEPPKNVITFSATRV